MGLVSDNPNKLEDVDQGDDGHDDGHGVADDGVLGGVAVVVVLRLLVHDEVLAPVEVLHTVALLLLAVEAVLIL